MEENAKREIKELFIKRYKDERLAGTLVVIAMIVTSFILSSQSDKIHIDFPSFYFGSFCLLIYFKFLYDIKRKLNKRIEILK